MNHSRSARLGAMFVALSFGCAIDSSIGTARSAVVCQETVTLDSRGQPRNAAGQIRYCWPGDGLCYCDQDNDRYALSDYRTAAFVAVFAFAIGEPPRTIITRSADAHRGFRERSNGARVTVRTAQADPMRLTGAERRAGADVRVTGGDAGSARASRSRTTSLWPPSPIACSARPRGESALRLTAQPRAEGDGGRGRARSFRGPDDRGRGAIARRRVVVEGAVGRYPRNTLTS